MPPRNNPTARQVRLGVELRRMREAAGVTARDAAALLGASQTQISHIESGRFGISEERLRRLAAQYRCSDRQLVDALADMTGKPGVGWWEKYRGLVPPQSLDLAELEHHSAHLRSVEIAHIPGVLQTRDHARAVFSYVGAELTAEILEAYIAFRMERRAVIEGVAAVRFDVIVHEAALRIRVGGRRVARVQLEHILSVMERGNVGVRVVPFDAEDFAGAGNSMHYMGGAVSQLDTVQLDTAHGSIVLDEASQLVRYRGRFERVGRSALGINESRDVIHRIAREM